MPCNDVTELIRVMLDGEDRLKEYRFIKRTCGQGVGADALLIEDLRGRALDELLDLDPAEYLADHPADSSIEEFLVLKHVVAVQSALEVLTGRGSGGPKDLCQAAEIAFEDGETTIDAKLIVDLVTARIASCGNCKGCGKTRKKPKKVAFFA